MDNNIIGTSDPGIVVRETQIKISDAKLTSALSRAYEDGQKDANKPKLCNHFPEFFSVAISLLFTLLTSEFKSFGCISADFLTNLTITVFIFCLGAGFVLMFLAYNEKTKSKTEERDIAVDKIFNVYIADQVGIARKRTNKKSGKQSKKH